MEMLHHFAHFFMRAALRWIIFLGTSPGGIISQIVLILLSEVKGGWWKLGTWRTNWRGGLRRAIYALLSVWAIAFFVSAVMTIYDDHQYLVAKANAPKPVCQVCPSCSTCPPPKVIIHTVEETHKCWMTNHFEPPGPRKENVLTATTVIIHCNYKVEAPFTVQLEFAADNFIGGDSAFLPDEGIVMTGAGGYKRGRMTFAVVNSPSLPVQELVTVLVLGTTDQYPRAIRYAIGSK